MTRLLDRRFPIIAGIVAGMGIAVSVAQTFMGFGVDTNVLGNGGAAVTANYQVAATDCGKTLQLGAGTTGFFTLTFPAVTGFPANCSVRVLNYDNAASGAGRGKAIAGLTGMTKLYADQSGAHSGQSFAAKIVSGGWTIFDRPSRSNIPIGALQNFYISASTGAGTNDCMSAATPCATSAQLVADLAQNFDINGVIQINYDGATYTNLPFLAPQLTGAGTAILNGNGSTLTCNAQCGSATNNCVICFEHNGGSWQITGLTISSTATVNNGLLLQSPVGTNLSITGTTFGAIGGVGLNQIFCQFGGSFINVGTLTLSGGASNHAQVVNYCVIHETSATITLTGSPVFSSSFIRAHNNAVAGIGNIYSGAAGGGSFQCLVDGLSVLDSAGAYTSIPGSANSCLTGTTSGGVIN